MFELVLVASLVNKLFGITCREGIVRSYPAKAGHVFQNDTHVQNNAKKAFLRGRIAKSQNCAENLF